MIGSSGPKISSCMIIMSAVAPTAMVGGNLRDRKSTRLNSIHSQISYAVFCLQKNIIVSLNWIIYHFGIVVGIDTSDNWNPEPTRLIDDILLAVRVDLDHPIGHLRHLEYAIEL